MTEVNIGVSDGKPDPAHFRVLATDYDGTLASQGIVDGQTVEALRTFARAGGRVVLVTGRVLAELRDVFPQLDICTLVVAENGAVVYDPQTRVERALAPAAPDDFVIELRRRGCTPLEVGRVVVATREPFDADVLEVVAAQGLELQIVYNKGAVMVLPTGVNKGTGLQAALGELGVDAAEVVGVGDAENDHSLLRACGFSAAVANAIPSLKESADVVLTERSSAGVRTLMQTLIDGGFSRPGGTRT